MDAAQIKAFFETAVSGAPSERLVWKTTRLRTYTTPTTLLFEAVDLDAGDRWIHKSFIRRTQDTVVVPLDPEPRRFGLPPSPARPRRWHP